MARKKKTEAPKAPLTFMLGKQDRLELHELYMISIGQQLFVEQLGQAVQQIVQAGQQQYLDKLDKVKTTLGLQPEDRLFCNFVLGTAEVRNEAPAEVTAQDAPPA